MSEKKQSGGVKLTRSKQVMFTPPGILGYNNLEKPDEKYGKLSVDLHLNDAGQAALVAKVEAECVGALWEKWLDEHTDEKTRSKAKRPDVAEFIAERMKEPKDGKPFPENFLRFSVAGGGTRKDQTTYTRTMAVWDRNNKLLDLSTLKLGRGSIVQVGVMPGIFANPLIKNPQPSFQLVGVRVLKLVQFGGSRVEAINEDDISAVLGADFEMEDLSEYASSPKRSNDEAESDTPETPENPF